MPTLLDDIQEATLDRVRGDHEHSLTTLTACAIYPHVAGHSMRQKRLNALPSEADFILSAMEVARYSGPDRRATVRSVLRTVAELQMYSDRPGDAPWVLYTRDSTIRGLGFISRRRLPLGHGGLLQVRGPNSEDLAIACTIRRCYEAVNGWYEGSISFNRDQWAFDSENTSDAD